MDLSRSPQAVEVSINTFLLDGFERRERHTIAAAFQVELTRLLHEQGIPKRLIQSTEQLAVTENRLTPSLQLTDTMPPDAIGMAIAQSIYDTWREG